MAHHKRRRPKTSRAGCLMCKPWKHQRTGKFKSENRRTSDYRRDVDGRQQVLDL